MKFLVGLSLLQTVAIVALIAVVVSDRSTVDSSHSIAVSATPETVTPETVTPETVASRDTIASGTNVGAASESLNEARLRTIIREELVAQQMSVARKPTNARNLDPNDAQAVAAMRVQSERVAQTIETYKSMGAINDQQLQALQDDIAQLDDANRKQLMSSLARAINSGLIKSRQ